MKSRFKKILVMLMIGIPFLLGACSKESEKLVTLHIRIAFKLSRRFLKLVSLLK